TCFSFDQCPFSGHADGFTNLACLQFDISEREFLVCTQDDTLLFECLESLFFDLQRIGTRLKCCESKSALFACWTRSNLSGLVARDRYGGPRNITTSGVRHGTGNGACNCLSAGGCTEYEHREYHKQDFQPLTLRTKHGTPPSNLANASGCDLCLTRKNNSAKWDQLSFVRTIC